MRIVIILLILFCQFAVLRGQLENNRLYRFDDRSTAFFNTTNIEDTLYISGIVFNEDSRYWDFSMVKADSFLNIIDTTFISIEQNFNIWYGGLINTPDEEIVAVGNMSHAKKWAFIKTNPQLDIESFQIYQDTTVSVYRVRAVTQSDGYYYAVGYIAPYLPPPRNNEWIGHGFMIKLDTLGNTIWQREYDQGLDTSVFLMDTQFSNDGNLLISGYVNNAHDSEQNYWSAPYLLKVAPETGNIIRSYLFEDERIVIPLKLSVLDDGSILSGGYRVNYAHPDYNLWFLDIVLQRIDTSSNLIWEQKIGPLMKSFDSQIVYEILPMPDGRFAYVACNELGLNYNSHNQSRVAVTAVFDADTGNIDWTRIDSIPYPGVNNEWNYVQGATILSSGSIVISGFNNTPSNVRGWLLKIDKNGCVGDDCSHYLPTATNELTNEAVEIPLIIPNPTSGTFRLSKDIDSDLYIYDLQGRLVHKIDKQQTKGEIGIGFLDAGMYFVWGYLKGKEFVVKLVKM